MSNPDISPVGFAATDHPHSTLERRRSGWWMLLGCVLVVGGVVGVAFFVWQMTAGASDPSDDAVAAGRVAALSAPPVAAANFNAVETGQYTVWIDTGGAISTVARSAIVGAANCDATLADGTTTSFRGAVQGSRVEAGDFVTVGTFDAPAGETTVVCRSELFGPRSVRDQLDKARDFHVTPGAPAFGWVSFVALFAGIPALILGTVALGRGWLGSLRRRR